MKRLFAIFLFLVGMLMANDLDAWLRSQVGLPAEEEIDPITGMPARYSPGYAGPTGGYAPQPEPYFEGTPFTGEADFPGGYVPQNQMIPPYYQNIAQQPQQQGYPVVVPSYGQQRPRPLGPPPATSMIQRGGIRGPADINPALYGGQRGPQTQPAYLNYGQRGGLPPGVQQMEAAPQLFDPTALLNQYNQKYDQARAANEQRYGQIMGGYGDLQRNFNQGNQRVLQGYQDRYNTGMGLLQGLGDSRARDIQGDYAAATGRMNQQMVTRGLGNTTVVPSLQRGIDLDRQRSLNQLNESVRTQTAGLHSQLSGDSLGAQAGINQAGYNAGLGQLNFMERRTDAYPDLGAMGSLMSGVGAANQALLNSSRLNQQRTQYNNSLNGYYGGGYSDMLDRGPFNQQPQTMPYYDGQPMGYQLLRGGY